MLTPTDAATILLVGPSNSSIPTILLARKELRVLWATSLDEACAVVGDSRARLVLVFGHLARNRFLHFSAVVDLIPGCACVYVRENGEFRPDAMIATSAGCEIVDARDMDRIIEIVANRTAVRLASEPRVPFDGGVRVTIGTRRLQLRGRDLSRSGIALWGRVEGVLVGDSVDLEIHLGLRTISASARIMRINDEANDPNVGLLFEDEADRQAIGGYIAGVLSAHRDRRDSVNALFDDLTTDLQGAQPLVTGDIAQMASSSDLRSPELQRLAELASSPWKLAAGWIHEVASLLTTTERSALENGGSAIVVRGVVMRMRLAKVRAIGNGSIPADLFNDCVRFLEDLAEYRGGIRDAIEIRTWFIRELAAPIGTVKQMAVRSAA